MTPAARRRVRRRVAALLALSVLGLGAAGCTSSASPSIAPSGVDELVVVPVTVPDPADFVAKVDNPWLALPADAGPEIAGVATTQVRSNGALDFYAQDTRGNVWWFGREDVWAVAEDGAEAGLVITATPRLGDGYRSARYRSALAPIADVDLVAEVVGIGVDVRVGTTTYQDCVVIETRDLVSGRVERASYAVGIGRVDVPSITVD